MADSGDGKEHGHVVECLAVVVIVAVGVGSAAAVYAAGPSYLMTQALLMLPADPGWVWYVAWGLSLMLYIVAMVPLWQMFMVASGLMFGLFYGSAINFCGTFGAAVVSMALGRTLLQEPVRRWVEEGDLAFVRRSLRVMEDSDDTLKLQMLFRFLYIPIGIRNYGPGTLDIPFWKLVASSIPHCIWISCMFSSLGSSMKSASDIVKSGGDFALTDMNWHHSLMFVVSLLISTLFAIYAGKVYTEHAGKEGGALVRKETEPSTEKTGP